MTTKVTPTAHFVQVYQENVYAEGAKFHSFREVVRSMGPAYKNFQLTSFNSTSKGFLGE